MRPSLPVSIEAPFIHLEQKFMHLGYLVYDPDAARTSRKRPSSLDRRRCAQLGLGYHVANNLCGGAAGSF